MRKVVVTEFLSVDGVAEDADKFITGWDDVVDTWIPAAIATQDAVVLGRRSHDDWAAYWPTSEIEPFASFINKVTKYVATSRPLDVEWAGASAIEGELAGFVRELKERRGGDIGVHASISVAQALLAADLVDELRFIIAPCTAGTGRRLLDGVPAVRLETLRNETSPTGYVRIDYRVIHAES